MDSRGHEREDREARMNELRLLAATLLSGMLASSEDEKDEKADQIRLERSVDLARKLIEMTPQAPKGAN
jgi:hypothetical protein